MKQIKLSETQKKVLDSLNTERAEAERYLKEVNQRIHLTSTLLFDFHGEKMPEQVKYENGVIEYEE